MVVSFDPDGEGFGEAGFFEMDRMAELTRAAKVRSTARWLPTYLGQRVWRRAEPAARHHLILAVADHFEPAVLPRMHDSRAERGEQERRLERWCREYPRAVDPWRDADGWPLRHTYFYPAEQYDPALISQLAEHCRAGWGEIEVHLHHGLRAPDTAGNTRQILGDFRDALAGHGCLSRLDGSGLPRYAFVHGNWALANSNGGRFCGVDAELQVLAETGCYADFTLPSAPHPAQIRKINSLYECAPPLDQRAAHRRGTDLEKGRAPRIFPLMVQGPLSLKFSKRARGLGLPSIENGELTSPNPPTIQRLELWKRAGVGIRGISEWRFIKLHCHGMDPRDESAMYGPQLQQFLRDLLGGPKGEFMDEVHFVTAREMVNIILAACDGREGNPGAYRDYRLQLIQPCRIPSS